MPQRQRISASATGRNAGKAKSKAEKALSKNVPSGWTLIKGTMSQYSPVKLGPGRVKVTLHVTIVTPR
jgi:hypothetical protein